MDIQIPELRKSNVTLRTTRQGVEICLASLERETSNILGILAWFIVWSISGNHIVDLWRTEEMFLTAVFLGMGWLCGECWALYKLLSFFTGKEIFLISSSELIMKRSFCGLPRAAKYPLSHLRNVRVAHQRYSEFGKLRVDYQRRTIKFGKNLHWKEAGTVATLLSDMLIYSCATTEVVLFGDSAFLDEIPENILHNPDVSQLISPLFHLNRIIIETETYDFHQVERFFTYALNALGQTYLKKEVSACVYGKPDRLHPLIHNNLINFCKSVELCEA